MPSQDVVVSNYFNSGDRNHYNKASHLYFEDDTLYSYGSHFILAQKAKNGYILNGDKYSITTSSHQNLTRSKAPKYSPIIPFTALENIFKNGWLSIDELSQIEIIDVTGDTYTEVTRYDKEGNPYKAQEHHLGASLIRYKGKYYLSSIDPGSKDYSYFLCELKGKPASVEAAFRDLAGNLTDEEYQSYQEGIIQRQGEYFLKPVELTTKDLKNNGAINPRIIQRNIDLSNGNGNAHIARDYLRLPDAEFIRGTLRHNEHKMIRMGQTWYRVIKNTAINSWSANGSVD
jgi:hypothetical protein